MSAPRLTRLGRYRILETIGRGAMGIVYKAEDSLLNRTVAIKTILMSASQEERADYEARFYQEAKAAGGLNHPNIITIHDIGREGDVVYMAMELLDGVELRELIRRGELPLASALDVVAQVADGLAFAHEQGVVHRDIKPANVMIVRGTLAKIMDFGIAKVRLSDVKTQAGSMLGSPKYMSPEQVAGTRTDHRSDIFSLGVTLYEMTAGVPPFVATEVGQLMYQVSSVAPRPPSSVNPALPPMLDLIVARALEKDPASRYQSARELAADLRACRAELPEVTALAPAGSEAAPLDLHLATTVPVAKTVPLEKALKTGKALEETWKLDPQAIAAATAPGSASRLSVSRRFDSSGALERLRAPQAAAPARGARFLQDSLHRKVAIAVVAALMVAVAMAFL